MIGARSSRSLQIVSLLLSKWMPACPLSILQPRDATYLRNRGKLTGPDEHGFLQVHKTFLAQAIGLEFDGSENSDPSEAFGTIPASVVSRATLVYMGYSDPAAEELWARWLLHNHDRYPLTQADDDDPDRANSFLVFALGAISSDTVYSYRSTIYRVACPGNTMQHWRRTLNYYGLRRGFIDTILSYLASGERQASDIMVKRLLRERYQYLIQDHSV
ncbi:hypothetical protein PG996_008374 [Apiospora saccharicola]|uniref:Uncharacterized protein n=1 Tax=Apiospora saccharicola TaxID=335842 RepID=A0ABR1UXR0_9PEZI